MEDMQYTVETIEADESGFDFFLTRYKPFRLNALQTDPSCFGSNYASEVAFDDETWRDRLRRPGAKTFVAVRSGHGDSTRGDILSSVTMVRAEQPPPPEVLASVMASIVGKGVEQPQTPVVHFVVNGVYTRPDARRRGIAHAVMAPAVQYALDQAASEWRPCLLTVLAYKHNARAILLYQKAGFVIGPGGEDEDAVTLSLYRPFIDPRVGTAF